MERSHRPAIHDLPEGLNRKHGWIIPNATENNAALPASVPACNYVLLVPYLVIVSTPVDPTTSLLHIC